MSVECRTDSNKCQQAERRECGASASLSSMVGKDRGHWSRKVMLEQKGHAGPFGVLDEKGVNEPPSPMVKSKQKVIAFVDFLML
jgi:hypothetical protein